MDSISAENTRFQLKLNEGRKYIWEGRPLNMVIRINISKKNLLRDNKFWGKKPRKTFK